MKRREGIGAALRCLLWGLPNSIFEATRKRVRPQYWEEPEFTVHLQQAGVHGIGNPTDVLRGSEPARMGEQG